MDLSTATLVACTRYSGTMALFPPTIATSYLPRRRGSSLPPSRTRSPGPAYQSPVWQGRLVEFRSSQWIQSAVVSIVQGLLCRQTSALAASRNPDPGRYGQEERGQTRCRAWGLMAHKSDGGGTRPQGCKVWCGHLTTLMGVTQMM
jgi:hypothetical protein